MRKKLGEVLPIVMSLVEDQAEGIDSAIPMLVGPPGIGKTYTTLEQFNQRGWGMIHIHIPLKPIEELSGIPLPTEFTYNGNTVKGTVWTLPDILKPISELSERYPIVGVFFDDMHLASTDHLALCHELFTEKTIRGYKIPDNVAFILAGNESSKAGARTMFSSIVNRVAWLKVTHDLESWKQNFAFLMGIHPAIIAFLTNDQYSAYAQEEEKAGEPWASLRSWSRFSNVLKRIGGRKFQDVLYYATAYVGKNAASEFANFLRLYDAVDAKKILTELNEWKLPENPTKVFIATRAVTAFVLKSTNSIKKYATAYSKFCSKIIHSHPEIGVSLLKDLLLMEKEKKIKVYDKVMDFLISKEPEVYEQLISDLKLV